MLCQHCNKPIPKERGGKNMRWKVKWCSIACRSRAFRRKNGQGESFAFRAEELASEMYNCTVDRKSKVDTIIEGKLVDIKASKPYKRPNRPNTEYWVFNRSSKEQKPDYFLCMCFDKNENLVRTYEIPGEEFPDRGITIGQKSKWDKYLKDNG